MTPQDWAYLIGACATALGVREVIPRIGGWLTGSGGRRRSEIDRMAAEVTAAHLRREAADRRADAADENRRIWREYASRLRAAYFEKGWKPEPEPEIDRTIPRDQIPKE